MIKFLQLPFYFDAKKMQQEVEQLSNWNPHFQTLHYVGEWSAIPLRNRDGNTKNIIVQPGNSSEFNDTSFLKACPYLQEILTNFKCPLQTVRLMKLNAGAVIKAHRDNELFFEKGEVRIHIPVTTHPKVEFYFENDLVEMKEGECWYGNFSLLHSVKNNSPVNRVHLVIDGIVNDWVKQIFESSEVKNKKETEVGKDYNVYENTSNQSLTDNEETKRKIIAELRNLNTPTGNILADNMEASLL